MDEVTFPVAEASRILERTMRSIGYGRDMAELGVWSGLWLERRGTYGITQLIVYMMLIKELPFESLRPMRHSEYGISGICPFMLASFMASREDLLLRNGKVALGAPASSVLFAPAVADLVSQSGRSLRIRHESCSCLYSDGGVAFESDDFGTWGFVNDGDNGPMLLEVTEREQLAQA